METQRQNLNSSKLIDQVPVSTPDEIALGHAIVAQELGGDFWLTPGLPRHVGTKGDDRVYGETVMIETDSRDAAQRAYGDPENLARISNRITNSMPAVVKVLFDLFGKGIREQDGAANG